MTHTKNAIVIGGGIAGCSSAYSLAKRGWQVTLIEQAQALAQGASGNPIAVLYARLTGNPSLINHLAIASFEFSHQLLSELNLSTVDYQKCGVLQLSFNPREIERHLKFMAGNPQKIAQYMNQTEASAIAGIPLNSGGLFMPNAGWVNPSAFCKALANHPNIHICYTSTAITLAATNDGWQVFSSQKLLAQAPTVIIANANQAKQFAQTQHLPLTPVRGQLSSIPSHIITQLNPLKTIVCGDSYLSPIVDDYQHVGTTFSPNDLETSIRDSEHIQNLSALNTITHVDVSQLNKTEILSQFKGRVASRCQTTDYLPLAGQLMNAQQLRQNPPRINANSESLPWIKGLYINVGHGAKGLITAPYCAELIAESLTSSLPKVSRDMLNVLNPNRFLLRDLGLKQLAKTALMYNHADAKHAKIVERSLSAAS